MVIKTQSEHMQRNATEKSGDDTVRSTYDMGGETTVF